MDFYEHLFQLRLFNVNTVIQTRIQVETSHFIRHFFLCLKSCCDVDKSQIDSFTYHQISHTINMRTHHIDSVHSTMLPTSSDFYTLVSFPYASCFSNAETSLSSEFDFIVAAYPSVTYCMLGFWLATERQMQICRCLRIDWGVYFDGNSFLLQHYW